MKPAPKKEKIWVKEILLDLSLGVPLAATARRIGVSWRVLNRVCMRNKIEYIKTDVNRLRADDSEVVKLFKEGIRAREIAARYGVSRESVYRRLRKV
jgi:transposase-like protein